MSRVMMCHAFKTNQVKFLDKKWQEYDDHPRTFMTFRECVKINPKTIQYEVSCSDLGGGFKYF